MAIFHLSIRPISRAKGHSAVAQIAYDTRCKLTNERTGEKLDWSKHKQDVIQWQVIGPTIQPGELATRAERAENRWDARVGRAMDVALPGELTTKAFRKSSLHDKESEEVRNQIWRQRATRIDPVSSATPTGWLCVENRALPITEIDLLEIIPGRGLHIRTRQESWLVSLPEELQSGELLRAITSGEVNCLSGSCKPYEQSSESSKSSDTTPERD